MAAIPVDVAAVIEFPYRRAACLKSARRFCTTKITEKIRTAIQKVKPDAIMLAEESAPVDCETAFDATYDFEFYRFLPQFMTNPKSAGQGIRNLEHARNVFPPGALQLRFLAWPGPDYTVASPRCGTDCGGNGSFPQAGSPRCQQLQAYGILLPVRLP